MTVQPATQLQVSALQEIAKKMCSPTECVRVTEKLLSTFSITVHNLLIATDNGILGENERKVGLTAQFEKLIAKMRVSIAKNTLTTRQCTALFLTTFRLFETPTSRLWASDLSCNPFAQAVANHDFTLAQKLILDNPRFLDSFFKELTGVGRYGPLTVDTSLLDVFCNRRDAEAVDFLLQIGAEVGETRKISTIEWIFNSFRVERGQKEQKAAEAVLRKILNYGYDLHKWSCEATHVQSTKIYTLIRNVSQRAFEALLPILVDEGNAKLDEPCLKYEVLGFVYPPLDSVKIHKDWFSVQGGISCLCRALIFNGASVPERLKSTAEISYYFDFREKVIREYCEGVFKTLNSLEYLRGVPPALLQSIVKDLTSIPDMRALCYEVDRKNNPSHYQDS